MSPPSAAPGPSPTGPARRSFALTGRSVSLDPKTNAVRGDIADVRLAEYVFAPHYAAAMPRVLKADALLCGSREEGVEPIAHLRAGDRFDVLDVAGKTAWGIAVAQGLVGYVAITAVEDLTP